MLKLIVRIVAGALIVFGVWEMSARVEDWWKEGAPLLGRYDYSLLLTQDELGPRGRPHARYLKWKLNSLGYRGDELQSGSRRLATIGASETFGLFEQAGQEYPRLIESELRRMPGTEDVEVVNVALAGQGLPAFTRRVTTLATQVKPRWALIYPSLANYISPPPAFTPTTSRAPAPSPWHSRAVDRIDALLKRSLPEPLQVALKRFLIWKAVRGHTVLTRIPDSRLDLFEQDLTALVESLRVHSIEPILVTHATCFGNVLDTTDRAMLISWRKFYPELAEAGFLDMEYRLNQRLREVAGRLGAPLVDAAAEMPPGRENFADFAHFTNSGSHKMAALLARHLHPRLARHP